MLDELVGLVQEAKQVLWSSGRGEAHTRVEELRGFLLAQVQEVVMTEERLGAEGELTTPTGHVPPNLAAEAAGPGAVQRLLVGHLRAVAEDVRAHAGRVDPGEVADLLGALAQGLDDHAGRLGAAVGS